MYEPMVLWLHGVPVRTSRTARRGETPVADAPSFHADCYARREIG